MTKKKYIVTLTEEERAELQKMVSTGKSAARKLTHARILLLAGVRSVLIPIFASNLTDLLLTSKVSSRIAICKRAFLTHVT